MGAPTDLVASAARWAWPSDRRGTNGAAGYRPPRGLGRWGPWDLDANGHVEGTCRPRRRGAEGAWCLGRPSAWDRAMSAARRLGRSSPRGLVVPGHVGGP